MRPESEKTIAVLSKNLLDEVRVTIAEINQKPHIAIAVFDRSDGTYRRGLTFSPWMVEELIPALQRAVRELQKGQADDQDEQTRL